MASHYDGEVRSAGKFILAVGGLAAAGLAALLYVGLLLIVYNGTEFSAAKSTYERILLWNVVTVFVVVVGGYLVLAGHLLHRDAKSKLQWDRTLVLPIAIYVAVAVVAVPSVTFIGLFVGTAQHERVTAPIEDRNRDTYSEQNKIVAVEKVASAVKLYRSTNGQLPDLCIGYMQVMLVESAGACADSSIVEVTVATEPFNVYSVEQCQPAKWELRSELYFTYDRAGGRLAYCRNDGSEVDVPLS